MGMLVDGNWEPHGRVPTQDGRFKRGETTFRRHISRDDSSVYAPEAGRYHLYASLACPWTHRTLLAHALKNLEDQISVSITHHFMGENGWYFDDTQGCSPDPIHGAKFLWEIFLKTDPNYTGRVRVPVLWDRQCNTIVNNESREIMRMFDQAFDSDSSFDLYPPGREDDVEATIDAILEPINNAPYRAGFAETQEAYDEAIDDLFGKLDHYEKVLGTRRYLLGRDLTAADLAMFATLVRFDVAYHTHFKCNVRQLAEYPNLWNYTKDIYQLPKVAQTCNFHHMRQHYYRSHESINPKRIVGRGPTLDFMAPHDRNEQP